MQRGWPWIWRTKRATFEQQLRKTHVYTLTSNEQQQRSRSTPVRDSKASSFLQLRFLASAQRRRFAMGAEERIRPPSPGTSNRVTPENSLDNLKSIEAKLPVADSLFGGPAEQLAPECDEGNIEYKLKLVDVDDDRFDRLVTQLRYRLTEGLGEALYELGVGDDGKPHGLDENDLNESLSTLRRMAAAVGAEVTVLHCREGRSVGHVIEAIVRERPLDGGAGLIELRVAVVGNVDSGKSTLVGAFFGVQSSRRWRTTSSSSRTAQAC